MAVYGGDDAPRLDELDSSEGGGGGEPDRSISISSGRGEERYGGEDMFLREFIDEDGFWVCAKAYSSGGRGGMAGGPGMDVGSLIKPERRTDGREGGRGAGSFTGEGREPGGVGSGRCRR